MATSLVSTGVQFPDASIQTTAATGAIGGTTASGSVTLTSSSAGAQSITPTANGQYVKLPSATTMSKGGLLFAIQNNSAYDLKIIDSANTTKGFIKGYETATVGLADNSTAAGVWTFGNTVLYGRSATAVLAPVASTTIAGILTIDSDRDLYLLNGGNTGYAIVYSKLTGFGSLTTIRTTNNAQYIQAIKTTTDQFFLATGNSTALQASILTFSGTTITQGTIATATVGSLGTAVPRTNNYIALISSTSVVTASTNGLIGYTISGTTVTIGSNVSFATAITDLVGIFSTGSSTAIVVYYNSTITEIKLAGVTLSGTTAVESSVENFSQQSLSDSYFGYVMNGSRLAWFGNDSSSNNYGYVTSVSGAATSTTNTGVIFNGIYGSNQRYFLYQNKFMVVDPQSTTAIRLISFNCGTATASLNTTVTITTAITTSTAQPRIWATGTNQISIMFLSTALIVYTSDVSSAPTTPVFSYQLQSQSTPINTAPVTATQSNTGLLTAAKNSTNIIFNPLNSTNTTEVVIWGAGNVIISPTIPGVSSSLATLTVANQSGTCYGSIAYYSGSTAIRTQLSVFELAQ